MDRPRGYCAEWNKSGREGHMPYDSLILESTRQNKQTGRRETGLYI